MVGRGSGKHHRVGRPRHRAGLSLRADLRLQDGLQAELRLGLAIPTAEYQLMERTVSEAGGTREGIV